MERYEVEGEERTRGLAREVGPRLRAGDIVFLSGELGAGKTTFVRGLLEGLGYVGPVRSPTFNLVQTFETQPPVMHADLYRVQSYEGIGIEDYLDTHLCLIEWPDRAEGLAKPTEVWHIQFDFTPTGRRITVTPPLRV